MGQCGCGDTTPDFQFPGPDGITYGVQIYGGCHDCLTPVAVDIYRFGPESAAEWLDGAPLMPFASYDMPGQPHDAIASVPILDPEHLAAADEDADWEGADVVALRYLLPEAIRRTWNDWWPNHLSRDTTEGQPGGAAPTSAAPTSAASARRAIAATIPPYRDPDVVPDVRDTL